MKIAFFFSVLFIILSLQAYAISIGFPVLHIFREDTIEDDLKLEESFSWAFEQELANADTLKILNVRKVGVESVSSIIQAANISSKENIDLLVFGKLSKNRFSYELEIDIYDHGKKEIIKRIFSKSEQKDQRFLLTDAAKRTAAYLYELLGAKAIPERKYWEGWGMEFKPAWYGTVEGSNKVIQGAFAASIGIFAQPKDWWVDLGKAMWYFHWGVQLQYHIGLNTEKLQTFYEHGYIVGFPWATGISWGNQEIEIGVIPGFRLDYIYQELKYNDPKESVYIGPNLGFSLAWMYWLDEKRTIGVGVQEAIAYTWYSKPLLDNYIGLLLRWKL